HADAGVGPAVHGEGRGHLDIGVVEGLEFALPVVVLEIEEDRAQRAFGVEVGAGNRLHVLLGDAGTRGGRFPILTGTETFRRSARATGTSGTPAFAGASRPAARGGVGFEELA